MYKNHLNEILQKHNGNIFYTDASITAERVSIAIINEKPTTTFKLPESCSIYTVEVIAILQSVEHILDYENIHSNNIILLDSLSTLQNLKNTTNTTVIAN